MKRGATLEQIDASLERCQRRVNRLVNAIKKLSDQRKRLLRKQATCHCAAELEPHLPHRAQPLYAPVEQVIRPLPDPPEDLSIPAALLVGSKPPKNEADEKAIAEIKAEIEAKKAVKAKASAAKSKAKAKGELRKMPLQGKAALAFINKE